MNEQFEKVFIKTEEDLPKDGGLFIWHAKSNGIIDPLQPLFYDKELNPYLLQRFDWYLQPIEPKQIEAEKGKEMPKQLNTKTINLCDSCRFHPAECDSVNVFFGDGKGNDNVYNCDAYKFEQSLPKEPTPELRDEDKNEVHCAKCGKKHNPVFYVCRNCMKKGI